jgi:hypothetical protein
VLIFLERFNEAVTESGTSTGKNGKQAISLKEWR